ncbi:MAG: XDD3 family exosortase-dependent surface protein [Leptolyngbyaceae cyanobacterium]
MKSVLVKSTVAGVALLTGLMVGCGQSAWAGTLYDGWNYSIDSFNDGTEGRRIGANSKFEFYGLATRTTDDRVYFAVNSNLSLDGYAHRRALNGTIGYGDLFLNFANMNSVTAANGDENLYAIRFNEINDTTVDVGLYSNVTGIGLMTQNVGYSNLARHRNKVSNYGGQAGFGDLEITTSYFNHDDGSQLNKSAYGYTNIGSGERVGDIAMVRDWNLASDDMGLNFGHFGATGNYTFGFSVDRDLLPDGEFMAHLFAECDNDGLVLAGSLAEAQLSVDVPEPSSALGLAVLGLLGAGLRRLKSKQDAPA